MMNDGRQRSVNQYARSESATPLAMHQDQSESTNYYSVIKDVPSATKTARSENDGYAMAKDVAPQGGVKKDDDTTNPYDMADSDTDGTTNPAFVDDYNHIGAGARNKDAASSGGKRDDYNHVNTDCARVSKTNRNADEMSNEYHELERVDSDATPHTANNDGGHTPHDDYNRLGDIKAGNPAATEGRGATPQAYDHVGLTETEGDPYDLARQDNRNQRVDPDYNRLGDI
ncbi:uncharacterized protein [Littorina saxatilis]|uniref:uncharacterized protein n=1 Tax=Littorina saxatilis TaxID=31220 RepID=UPI0038B635C1